MQDLNDMVFFAEVVDRGGFAAAGRVLGIPKSKLSRRVAELEGRLGVRLLQRTTRKLSLTPAGEVYHRHCVAIRDEAQAAGDALALVQSEPRGVVRVTCPVTLAQSSVGVAIASFAQAHPLVRVEMQVTNRPIDLVEEGVDVALRVRPVVEDSANLIAKVLGHSRGLIVCSPELLVRHGKPESAEELARFDAVAMSAVDGRTTWKLHDPDGRLQSLAVRVRYVADDLLVVKAATIQGVGMAIIPDYLCSDVLASGQLVEVLPGYGPPPGILHAVFTSRRGLVPAVRQLIDHLAANVKGETLSFGPGA